MGLLNSLRIEPKDDSETGSEIGSEFAQDPTPGDPPRAKRRPAKTAPATPKRATASTAKLAKEVAEDLASMIELSAAAWGMTDECCAPVLEAQAKPIADAFASILSRNPRLLAKFAETDLIAYTLQGGMLFRALKPVGMAVYQNHVSKAVEPGEEGGVNGTGHVHLGNYPAFTGITR